MDWFDRAAEELEDQLERGELTAEEHKQEMRELKRELESQASEAAGDAYNDIMGYFQNELP